MTIERSSRCNLTSRALAECGVNYARGLWLVVTIAMFLWRKRKQRLRWQRVPASRGRFSSSQLGWDTITNKYNFGMHRCTIFPSSSI
jgi:hypothetical protein